MSPGPGGASSAALAARWLVALGLFVVSATLPATAWAYWSGDGAGEGTASVATLPAPRVEAAPAAFTDTVDVRWDEPAVPDGMKVTGYVVTRTDGGKPIAACGSSPERPIPRDELRCLDVDVPDGDVTYTVTALVGSWTTTGTLDKPVHVEKDRADPGIVLRDAGSASALLDLRDAAYVLFFRPDAGRGGTVRIDAEVTDDGIGPASATFPAAAAKGWTHDAETVSVGTGTGATVTYPSSPFDFTAGAATPGPLDVTAADLNGNMSTVPLTFVADAVGPTGGALTVNGRDATAAGSSSAATSGSVVISRRTDFAEEVSPLASGMATTVLLRETAALAAGACGPFGSAMVIPDAAPVTQSGLPSGCYRYTLSGADRVGNASSVSTVVRMDTTPPTGGALSVNDTNADSAGTTSSTRITGWPIARSAFADAETDPTTTGLTRAMATFASGTCGAFGVPTTIASGVTTEGALATGCYRYVLTGTNSLGLAATLTTTVRLDLTAPTGGAVTVNGAAASAVGTTSTSTTGSFQVTALTPYGDADSAMAGTELVRTRAPVAAGVCGTFDSGTDTVVSGSIPIAQSGLAPGCYRYVLTGTNGAGGTSSVVTTVRVDPSPPTAAVLTVNGIDATSGGSTSGSPMGSWSIVRTDFTDPETPMSSSTLVRTQATVTNGVCGAFASASTLTGAPAQTGLVTNCYRYVLTGTNALGLTASVTTTVRADTSVPTGGALTVNAIAATAGGSTSNAATASFTVATLTAFADANSGMSGTALVRTQAPMTVGVCGAYDGATSTTVSGAVPITQSGLSTGCYRYVLTGTNNAGGAATLTTVVRVDTSAPTDGAVAVNGVAGDATGTTSYASAIGWPIARTAFVDPDTVPTTTLTRAAATYSAGGCGTYGSATTVAAGTTVEGSLSTNCYRYVLTGTNTSGLSSTVTTVVRLDTTVPTGGAVTVNAAAATAAGSTSTSTTGTFSVTVLTNYADTNSAMAGTTLVRTQAPVSAGLCGSFDPATATTISGAVPIVQTGLASGCYRYTLTGTNGVGGAATIFTTVRIDTSAPAGRALTVNGVDAAGTATTSTSASGAFGIATTGFADAESTLTNVLTRAAATITNGTCGTFGTATTITGATSETALATNCYRYVLTGTNSLGLVSSVITIVKVDVSAPAGGALTVNAVAATGAGSSSASASGTFPLSVLTNYSDANSGMTSSTVTRTTAPSVTGVCGAFDSATSVVIATTGTQSGLAVGCYRYTMVGVNAVGGASSISTTVRVGP